MAFSCSHRFMLAATVFAIGAISAGTVPARAGAPQAGSSTIMWDKYAVPHIYGPDTASVVRGLGYATMENHAELLLRKIARSRGRMAEYFGRGVDTGGGDNVFSDEQVIGYGIPAQAADAVKRGGSGQAELLEAYCDGVNEYASRHANSIEPVLRPILPMVPSDITAIAAYLGFYAFEDGQDFVQTIVADWQAGGAASASAQPTSRQAGSNAIVLAPSKSADGNAIIVANSHLPWGVNQPVFNNGFSDAVQLMEAQLVVGDPNSPSLNAGGPVLIGLPFLFEGFSDDAGWTHTANNIYNADLFQLTLDRTGRNYLFGGAYRPLAHRTASLKVRQADRSYKTVTLDLYSSVHGPVLAFNADHTKALALRMAGFEHSTSVVTQYWNMIRSKTLSEFKEAVAALQVPVFNTFFADRAGEIFYLFGGRTPVRNCPYTLTYSAGSLVPSIQDGANPRCLWTRTLPFDDLPQTSNPSGGYVANGNEAPWYASFPQPASLKPERYPRYITVDGMDFRPQHLHTFLNTAGKLSAEQLLAGKNSTALYLADRVLPDLLALARKAAAGGDGAAGSAAKILAAWDRTADEASVGGTLFEEWWDEVVNDVLAGKIAADQSLAYSNNPHPRFATPFDPARPLTTPAGLDASGNVQFLADLDHAYTVVSTRFAAAGGAAVTWGDAHKTTLVRRRGALQTKIVLPFVVDDPVSGADDEFGAIRVVNPQYAAPLGEFVSYGGESYIHVIEFTPKGATGGSLMVYGNASRPNSRHIGDQASLFRNKTLKPVLRSLADVQAAAVSTEHF